MELKDILAIKKATDSLDCTETHKLITLRENDTFGPITGLDSLEGRMARSNWFRNNIA